MTRNPCPGDTVQEEEGNMDPPEYTPPENNTPYPPTPKVDVPTEAQPQPTLPTELDAENTGSVEQSAVEQPKGLSINRNDPPQPGSIYIINESTSSKVITNEGGRIILAEYNGEPKKSQRWVCQRSGGWLGFTNDAGPETTYLGHDARGVLICTATWHLPWEHFNVLKREGDGFEFMVRHWFGSLPLGFRDDGANLGKREIPDTWWGFTKVV
ncbi:hypothetical protein TWF281_000592 [Arthrobotrys megalospora]